MIDEIVADIRAQLDRIEGMLARLVRSEQAAPAASVGDRLMTVREVARAASISERTVRAMIADGRLESRQIGRARRVPMSSIERLIAGQPDEAIEREAARMIALERGVSTGETHDVVTSPRRGSEAKIEPKYLNRQLKLVGKSEKAGA